MNTFLKRRLAKLECKLCPRKLHVMWRYYEETNEAAVERYEAKTGNTIRPGEQRIIIVHHGATQEGPCYSVPPGNTAGKLQLVKEVTNANR